MKRIAVYVATTGGAAQVERITRERAPQSMVCLKRSSTVLPISAAYDSFVRPGSGVVERVFGPFEDGAFRLDVSAPIESGGSWKLGFFVAHALSAAPDCELAGANVVPDEVIWLTGHVDYDLAVGAVGHIAEKVHASRTEITGWLAAGLTVKMFVHEGSDRDAAVAAGVPDGAQVVPVNSAIDVLTNLNVSVRDHRPAALQKISTPQRYTGWRTAAGLLIGGVTSFALAAVLMTLQSRQPTDDLDDKEIAPSQTFASETTAAQTPPSQTVLVSPTPPVKTPAPEPETSASAPDAMLNAGQRSVAETITTIAPAKVPTAADSVTLSIFERRAPAGRTCAEVQFGAVKAVKVPVNAGESQSSTSAIQGLCGLAMVVDNAEQKAFVAVVVNVLSGRLLSGNERPDVFSGQRAFAGTREWAIDVPRRLDEPFDIEVVAIGGKKPVAEDANWLKAQADPARAAQELAAKGVETSMLRHRILP